jgi:arylformamidase
MWKNLTKTELDAAYNNSKAVENSAQIIQAWLASSAIVKEQLSFANDIPYGQENFPALDFYLVDKNAPTIAFIHGGFWQMRSKNDFAFIVPTLIKNNFNVAMIGYRLAPYATMDEIVDDVKNGIDTTVKFLQSHSFYPIFYG